MKREIIAKTLMGKGKLDISEIRKLQLKEEASKTLGCWIINHAFEARVEDKNVIIEGQYDVQLWYATDNDQKTSVYYETVPFSANFNVVWKKLVTINDEKYLKVHVIKYPTASEMNLVDQHTAEIRIESEYFLDVFQEAILRIETLEAEHEDDIDEEIVMNVNPNYLTDKK